MILKKATRTTMAMLIPEAKDLEAIQQVAVNLVFGTDFPNGIASKAGRTAHEQQSETGATPPSFRHSGVK